MPKLLIILCWRFVVAKYEAHVELRNLRYQLCFIKKNVQLLSSPNRVKVKQQIRVQRQTNKQLAKHETKRRKSRRRRRSTTRYVTTFGNVFKRTILSRSA